MFIYNIQIGSIANQFPKPDDTGQTEKPRNFGKRETTAGKPSTLSR